MFAFLLTALTMLPFAEPAPPSAAQVEDVHEGAVLAAGEGKISIRDKDGENEVFTLAPTAKVLLNGQEAKLENIKEGDNARVTVQRKEGKLWALLVDARSRK